LPADSKAMRGVNPTFGKKGGRGRGGVGAGAKTFTPEQAKKAFLEFVSAGYNITAAIQKVDRSRKAYEYWRKNDPVFRNAVDTIMSTRKVDTNTRDGNRVAGRGMGFAAWRKKYLGQETFPHQMQWIDLLEGKDPRDLHPSQVYELGRRNKMVINCPPNHGKTTVVTMDYVTFLICINPAVKIAIISKTSDMAEDMVYGVKTRLTHPDNHELIRDFAPEGGFLATADEWSANRIRLASADRDPSDKDPTLQGLGLGSQVYGKRLDRVFVDDAVDGENAAGWQKQMRWLQVEVSSRPGASGVVCVIGTRISPADLYWQLRNPENFQSGKSPWTYLSQPAVLEEDGPRDKWKTLWPRATTSWYNENDDCWCNTDDCRHGDSDNLFPRWDGLHIGAVKDDLDANVWLQAYMQKEVGGNAAFPSYGISEATNKGRRAGRNGGMFSVPDDAYVIGSVDPATTGFAAIIVGAVSHQAPFKRYIYDAWNIKHPTPEELKNRIKAATIEFGVSEWRIEKTGLLTMFTQDFELNQWLHSRGVRLTQHYTGKNKFDTNFGVASMSPLFGQWQDMDDGTHKMISDPLIELPRIDTDGMRALVQQLTIWTPELDPKKTPCDMVMALWFLEIGCREKAKFTGGPQRRQFSGLVSPQERQKAAVYNMNDAWAV
jgi:hypothetical protein